MKKVRSKRIKGRPLDGEMLLELINNYIEVVNRGDLPNFELSYKHLMRFQIQRVFSQFMSSCDSALKESGKKMLSRSNL